MANFNKTVEELQPYVLSIRFNKGLTVVDTNFKDGWTVPKTEEITYKQTDEKGNYYMLYGLNDNIGVEEILVHVEKTIHMNIEREKKYELLKIKKKELENIFRTTPLSKCLTLKFMFNEVIEVEDEMSLKDMPIIEEEMIVKPTPPPTQQRRQVTQGPPQPEPKKTEILAEDITYSQQPKPAEELEEVKTIKREVDPEIMKWENQNRQTHRNGNQTIELPPKKAKIEVEEFNIPEIVCKCDPNDPNAICPVCMSSKM